MLDDAKHETAFVQSFIVPQRRKRYLSKLSSSKHRRSFLDRLNHQLHKDMDGRFIVRESRSWPDSADRCYIIADEREYDAKLVTVAEAIDAVSSAQFGIIVSFVPGKLACYKGESPSEVIWLARK